MKKAILQAKLKFGKGMLEHGRLFIVYPYSNANYNNAWSWFRTSYKNTISYGTNGGIKTVLGTISGMMIHTIMATLGLSAILMKFSMLFIFIKYAGALYLIYLAVKSIKSAFLKKKICKFRWK